MTAVDRRKVVLVLAGAAVVAVLLGLLLLPRRPPTSPEGAAVRYAVQIPTMLADGASDEQILGAVRRTAAPDGQSFVEDARASLADLRSRYKAVQVWLKPLAVKLVGRRHEAWELADVTVWVERTASFDSAGTKTDSLLEDWALEQIGGVWKVRSVSTRYGPALGSPLAGDLAGFRKVG